MTTAFLHASGASASQQQIAADFEAVGITMLSGTGAHATLVQEVITQAPDVLVCVDTRPGDELFRALQTLNETVPRAVLVFTTDSNAEHIARAVEVGVHAYIVNGYDRNRLRTLLHLAQARFVREQSLQGDVKDLAGRLEERKMVDRAKAILMRARQVSDDDAFQLLRTASMHTNQRMGQVSQQIIASARFAEDVNRAGQLRMLSQRLVTLALLRRACVCGPGLQDKLDESISRIDAHLKALGKSLSLLTFGDLLGAIALTWSRMRHTLQCDVPMPMPRLLQLDALAGQLLLEAERLTSALESAGAAAPLQVLNLAGRQRMLSQRFVKHALLEVFDDQEAAEQHRASMSSSSAAFEEALTYLNAIPLTSYDIRLGLDKVALLWDKVLGHVTTARGEDLPSTGAATAQPGQPPQPWLQGLAIAGEALLQEVEVLSERYERSVQMLLG